MKALIYYGPNNMKIEERSIPEVNDGDVLLKVIGCGFCGTDMRIFTFGHHAIKPPITTGHEIVGTVITTKSKDPDVRAGDHVIVVTPVGCMKCKYCYKGMQNMCPLVVNNLHSIGYYTDGGFADYILIPKEAVDQNVLIKIPKNDVPLEHYSLCEPLSCVINGQEKLKIKPEDTVAVIGAGPIGCMHVLLAKAQGAKKIILADRDKKKLKLVKNIPADIFIDVTKQNLKEAVNEITQFSGVDVVIVAAPSGIAQETAIDISAIQGRISFFGGLPQGESIISIQSNSIHYKELEIYGAFASTRRHYEIALTLIQNKQIDTNKLITHIISLKDIQKAIKIIKDGRAIKIVITPKE